MHFVYHARCGTRNGRVRSGTLSAHNRGKVLPPVRYIHSARPLAYRRDFKKPFTAPLLLRCQYEDHHHGGEEVVAVEEPKEEEELLETETDYLLSELVRDIETTKHARESFEQTKQQQIHSYVNRVENDLTASLKKHVVESKKRENSLQVDMHEKVSTMQSILDGEMDRMADEVNAMKSILEERIVKSNASHEREIAEAHRLTGERSTKLKKALEKEITDSTGMVKTMIDDLAARMNEEDIETRESLSALIFEKYDALESAGIEEAQKRAAEDKHLSEYLEAIVGNLNASVTAIKDTVDEFKNDMQLSMEELDRRVSNSLERESNNRKEEADALNKWVTSSIEEVVKVVEAEKASRVEDEERMLKRIGDDILLANSRVGQEAEEREEQIIRLAAEVERASESHRNAAENITSQMQSLDSEFRSRLEAERKERVQEDKKILLAISDYTKALQDALRTINA